MNRTMFGIAVAALATIAAFGFQTATSSDSNTISASRIEILNGAGTVVVVLDSDADGNGRITVLDQAQNQLASLPLATSGKQIQARSTSPESSSPGRCQAITKKGTQCSRNAQPGSAYCWQHKK